MVVLIFFFFFYHLTIFSFFRKKISEIKKIKPAVKRKDKSLTLQIENYLIVVSKENLLKIKDIVSF